MVDRARYVFQLSAWNELAGVDDFYTLFYFVRNDGKPDIEIIGKCGVSAAAECRPWPRAFQRTRVVQRPSSAALLTRRCAPTLQRTSTGGSSLHACPTRR